MPTNIEFTDNNRMANTFLKEIYIGAKWVGLASGDEMVLWQANNGEPQADYLIGIGLRSTFDPITGVVDGFLISHNNSSGVIKMDSKGIFKGVDCYVLVDWETAWTLPTSQTDMIDGVICFGAVICMNFATDISNSPTIEKYIHEQELGNLYPNNLPQLNFNRGIWTPVSTTTSVDVYDEAGLAEALLNHNSVTINLMADIPFQNVNSNALINISSKDVIINGNGHKIFDNASLITDALFQDGRYHADYNESVTGNEAFMTNDGKMLQLAKSDVYQAVSWWHETSEPDIFGLILPDELNGLQLTELDDVFISYRLSFLRMTYKVKICENGIIKFEVPSTDNYTRNSIMRALSPNTHFFLTNVEGVGGITIKNGDLSFPSEYHPLNVCTAKYIVRVKNNSRVELNNLKIIGGTEYGVMNDASVKLYQCEVTNIFGGGVYSNKEAYADRNIFHDILSTALRNEHYPDTTPLPYLEVTSNVIKNIGHYGTNSHAVRSNGDVYIAHNEFVDTNYSAIWVGKYSCIDENKLPTSLVQYNFIHYTKEWMERRKALALQDSGDIYVSTNNKQATIRFNRITGTGGLSDDCIKRKNNAIYCDGGAYNVRLYCNIISGTENYYDIDCRDIGNEQVGSLPSSKKVSTCNYIQYNVCDGYLRMQENTMEALNDEEKCHFIGNMILRKRIATGLSSEVLNGNLYYKLIYCKDCDGITTDVTGMSSAVALTNIIQRIL